MKILIILFFVFSLSACVGFAGVTDFDYQAYAEEQAIGGDVGD